MSDERVDGVVAMLRHDWVPAPLGYVPVESWNTSDPPSQTLPDGRLVIDQSRGPGGSVSVVIFDNADKTDRMLPVEEWAPLPNARKLCDAYNRPFLRNFRLRLLKSKTYEGMAEIIDPHEDAADALELARMIRADPQGLHIAPGNLEYYPHDGSVWRRGTKWLTGVFMHG